MSSSDKFNLTFDGEIRPGLNLTKVKVAFAQALTIEDAKRVDAFFTGELVTLRRNLDKETAEAFYTKIYRTGAILKLVPANTDNATTIKNTGMNSEFHTESPGLVDQSWPVPSKRTQLKPPPATEEKPPSGNASSNTPKAASKARTKAKIEVKPRAKPKAKAKTKVKVRKKSLSKAALAKAAEEAAIQQAVKEAAKKLALDNRQKAEEAALEQSARDAAARIEKEAAARLEDERRAAEDKARADARKQAVAKQRAAEQEVARLKAEKIAAEQKAAEDAKAAEAAALKQALAAAEREKMRREAAQKKAIEEAAIAKAAEQAALQKAREEQAKKEAMEIEAARIREEYAENKRIAAAKLARERAQEKRREAEKQVRLSEQKLQDAHARLKVLERETETAKSALRKLIVAENAGLQAGHGASSSDDSPDRQQPDHTRDVRPAVKNKRQEGAPNFFSLRPFQATKRLSQRAEQSGRWAQTLYLVSAASAVAFLLLTLRTALQPVPLPSSGNIQSIIVGENSRLILTAAGHIFVVDRAGVPVSQTPLSDFDLSEPVHLLHATSDEEFLVQTQLENTQTEPKTAGQWVTMNCNFSTSACTTHGEQLGPNRISSWVVDPRTGEQFIAIPSSNALLKLSPAGELIARATIELLPATQMQLSEGLLYVNSANGPAISIFRPDTKRFGEQLDEIILQPAPALDSGQTRVAQFTWQSDVWWVLLQNPETLQSGLYRFDQQWNFLAQVAIEAYTTPPSMKSWAGKVLVLSTPKLSLQRISTSGDVEAPLTIEPLQGMVDTQRAAEHWMARLWAALIAFLALAATASFALAKLYRIRQLIDNTSKYSSAQPIDNIAETITWLDPAKNRNLTFRILSVAYTLASCLVLAAVFQLQLSAASMLSAAIALAGPVLLIGFIWRCPPGHIGLVADGLILVDHKNTYHLGDGSNIHHRGNFLLVDDVVVFKGSSLLPVFDRRQIEQHLLPLVLAGVKVDRKTLWIKTLQSWHPFANGVLACFAAFIVAGLCAILA